MNIVRRHCSVTHGSHKQKRMNDMMLLYYSPYQQANSRRSCRGVQTSTLWQHCQNVIPMCLLGRDHCTEPLRQKTCRASVGRKWTIIGGWGALLHWVVPQHFQLTSLQLAWLESATHICTTLTHVIALLDICSLKIVEVRNHCFSGMRLERICI